MKPLLPSCIICMEQNVQIADLNYRLLKFFPSSRGLHIKVQEKKRGVCIHTETCSPICSLPEMYIGINLYPCSKQYKCFCNFHSQLWKCLLNYRGSLEVETLYMIMIILWNVKFLFCDRKSDSTFLDIFSFLDFFPH